MLGWNVSDSHLMYILDDDSQDQLVINIIDFDRQKEYIIEEYEMP
jgi:hypothetical protein